VTDNKGLICDDEQRREQVRASKLCGLDYLEVSDDPSNPLQFTVHFLGQAPEGWGKDNVQNLRIDGGRRIRNIQIMDLEVYSQRSGDEDDYMVVTIDKPGDFSTYSLAVFELDEHGQQIHQPHHLFDPRYSRVEFTFNAGGPTDLDCQTCLVAATEKLNEPEINYLAKDYASFRQIILDRLAVIMPGWQERHVPDIGVAIVEELAHVGDYLSYYQDAVATEAYLDTARQRISVRRHARLMDYQMHEGCNARAWVTLWVSSDVSSLKADDFFFITDPGLTIGSNMHQQPELPKTLPRPYVVFEPMLENRNAELNFYQAHNKIKIYTWKDLQCHLAKGATSATLLDHEKPEPEKKSEIRDDGDPKKQAEPSAGTYDPQAPAPEPEYSLKLREGDVVFFEEVKGPKTGLPEGADPSHRHAVRLTKVTQTHDPLNGNLLVEIEWGAEDALPFALCLSSINEDDCSEIQDVSVVRGNVLLVDHGEGVEDELGQVPTIELKPSCDPFDIQQVTKLAGKFAPQLDRPDLTLSEPLVAQSPGHRHRRRATKQKPASAALKQDVRRAVPQLTLYGFPAAPRDAAGQILAAFCPANLIDPGPLAEELAENETVRGRYLRNFLTGKTVKLLDKYRSSKVMTPELRQAVIEELTKLRQRWEPRPDLLESDPDDRHFVVEMDNDRRAHLRFGDGDLARMPDAGMTFQAVYRVGNGPAGNVGAETISHIVFRRNFPNGVDICPCNPFAAVGGAAPEPIAEAKLFAPVAFRKELQRAITADDYAAIVMRDFPNKVQRAMATLEWTGSRYEVQVAIDTIGRENADKTLLWMITRHLYQYRRIGHDLDVKTADYVPLRVHLTVHVLQHYLRGHVEAALLDVFSNRVLPDGRLGFFHPDNLTFGQGVYLSQLVATARAVAGVEHVEVTKLERLGEGPDGEIEKGILPLGPLEIARLENDANFPEHGILTLNMKGGR
jgi:hypothetical protein